MEILEKLSDKLPGLDLEALINAFPNIDKATCWLWTGAIAKNGAARLWNLAGSEYAAHQILALIAQERYSKTWKVQKQCPTAGCVNPFHFSLKKPPRALSCLKAKPATSGFPKLAQELGLSVAELQKPDPADHWLYSGPPRIKHNGKAYTPQRLAMEAYCGEPIPGGFDVVSPCGAYYHTRGCINPHHLQLRANDLRSVPELPKKLRPKVCEAQALPAALQDWEEQDIKEMLGSLVEYNSKEDWLAIYGERTRFSREEIDALFEIIRKERENQ